jgi:FtsZ-binding cell division protein ZapB
MSTRKFGTYASKEEFLENEIRTLNYYIQSMIDTMKVMSINKQDMAEEMNRMKQEMKDAVKAEREACAEICDGFYLSWIDIQGRYEFMGEGASECAGAIRARGQE